MFVRYVIQEGGQRREGVGAQAAELGHQVLPQPAIHQRHSQVVLGGGQQLPVVRALQVQLQVCGEQS